MLYPKRTFRGIDHVRLALQCAPVQGSLLILEKIVTGLSSTASILATASFIDTAVKIASGQAAARDAVIPIAVIVAVLIYSRAISSLVNMARVSMENRLRRVARGEMLELRAQLAYHHIENQEDQDLQQRVCAECDTKIMGMFDPVMNLLGMVVQIAGYVGILLVNMWWAVIAIAVFCVPLFYVGLKSGKELYEAGREVTKKERLYNYLSGVMSGRDAVEERYIFGFTPWMNEKFRNAYETARIYKKQVDKKNFIRMKASGLLMSAATFAMAAVLIYPAANGSLSVGLFMSLVSSVSGLVQMMSWSLTWTLSEIAKNGEYLRDLTKFRALTFLEDACGLPQSPPVAFESLEFQNVTFRYPGTEADILKGISFLLEKGRHYAVVGANGAGKTTLTKLITGLYDNYEGQILLNGRDLRDYTSAELKSVSAVVYQDFARYFTSVRDNIAVGDMNRIDSDDSVRGAVRTLDFEDRILALPGGYETHLGKIDGDGVDLSGGEWQKIALARTLVSPASLHILDEPTAALDPISESRVYRQFETISRGKTTVFISHRLGSTKLADTILVLGDGRVCERGTHAQLMALGGQYAKMYSAQAGWYAREEAMTGA